MDQFVFFIIIYIVFALFGILQKRMRGGASGKPKKQRRPRTQATGNRGAKRSPQQQIEDAEIPEFLRRMLGLEIEKRPAPQLQQSPPPEIIRGEKKYDAMSDLDETVESDPDLPSSAEGGHAEASLTKLIHKTEAHQHAKPYRDPHTWGQALTEKPAPAASRNKMVSMLKNPDSIRQAIVLREILDRPAHTRRYRLPGMR